MSVIQSKSQPNNLQPVGIIANPASGKDIRRLVACGSVFDNHEKVNIVRRILLGLDAMGVQKVFFMPDSFGIGVRALEGLHLNLTGSFLNMEMQASQEDSALAATLLKELNVACIITLGGDGTNRVVTKTAGQRPLLPISTGTNNVFPCMIESTLAGLAAGVLVQRPDLQPHCTELRPMLEIWRDNECIDIALVDVVVTRSGFVATRAVWDVASLREIFLTRARPGQIGFSSVGGHLRGIRPAKNEGLHLLIGPGAKQIVRAPIAPGLVRGVPIQSARSFAAGEKIAIKSAPALVALDGERELVVKSGERIDIMLNLQGPRVIDVAAAIRQGAEAELFEEPVT